MGVFWILFSDRVIYLLAKTTDKITDLQTIKGWVFVAVTAYLIYRFSKTYEKSIEEYVDRLADSEYNFKELNETLLNTKIELSVKYSELCSKEEAIRISEDKYKSIVEGISDVIWELNLDTNEMYFTERLTELLGYRIKGNVGYTNVIEYIHPDDKLHFIYEIENHISGKTLCLQCEFRVKTRTGEYKWVFCRGRRIKDNQGNIHKIFGSLSDITVKREYEEKLIKLAYYDTLTGLPNRVLFEEKLYNILTEAGTAGKYGSVLFLELDDLKKVNDTLGHDYGDQLIKITAQMLILTIEQSDELCRFGGDKFVILHKHIDDSMDEHELAKKILNIFDYQFEIGEKQVYISASMGIAHYPTDGIDTNTILKNADAAIYEAKRAGKNTYCFYNSKVTSEIVRKNELEKRMRTAIENNEFYLCYQPQFDVKDGRITSLEALIRWNSPEAGVIMPIEFISIAEESGLIIQIGEWVFKNVCRQCKEWRDKGYSFDFIGVNISPKQLQYEGFMEMVREALNEYSVGPNSIEIEITENVLIRPFYKSIEILRKLQELGVQIALDDFGTGYSSLNYLKMLPISTLKIDKTFIDNICNNLDGISIVDGIISLAHKMNLIVTAEGVEREEQFQILKEKQCDKIQGYYISKPLSMKDTESLLKMRFHN